MSFEIHQSAKARHVVLRASEGELLPGALLEALRTAGVVGGWLRATGILQDVSIGAYLGERRTMGHAYLLAGEVHALAVEGVIGLVDGNPSCSLRAVLGRQTDTGLETIAGEILSARAVSLDILVTCFDEPELVEFFEDAAGLAGLGNRAPSATSPDRQLADDGTRPGWPAAAEASADAQRASPGRPERPTTQSQAMPMPARPPRTGVVVDSPVPEDGDVVEHFAFGRCDVVRSDGDRLHLRIHKDGRVREIALEMLRVTRVSDEAERPQRFKLERRI